MIIRLEAGSVEGIETARQVLEGLAHGWGHGLVADGAPESDGSADAGDTKSVDHMAIATLVLTIPSAALAVLDLADRIQKRRRAKDLIDHAGQLSAQKIAVLLVHRRQPTELATLAPDELLDLLVDEPMTERSS